MDQIAYQQQKFIFHCPGDWEFHNQDLSALMSGESLLPDSQFAVFLLCPHMVDVAREILGFFFYKGTKPFMRDLPS